MTKYHLVERISRVSGIDMEASQTIINTFFAVVKQNVSQGQTIYVRKFGSFGSRQRARKVARLVKANTALIVEAHAIPWFKPCAAFIKQVPSSKHVH